MKYSYYLIFSLIGCALSKEVTIDLGQVGSFQMRSGINQFDTQNYTLNVGDRLNLATPSLNDNSMCRWDLPNMGSELPLEPSPGGGELPAPGSPGQYR